MKVKELIALLHREDPNADVVLTVGDDKDLYKDVDAKITRLPIDGKTVVLTPKT